MKTIQIKSVMTDKEAHEYLKKVANVEDAPVILDKEFIGVDENGVVQLVYVKLPEDAVFSQLKALLSKLEYNNSTRVGGLTTESTIFGFQPPVEIRMRPYCSMAALASKYPQVDAFLALYCKRVIMPLFEQYYAENLKEHMEAIKEIKPDWLMQGTPFTGGVVNNSNQLNYHMDVQNIKNSIACLAYFLKDVQGGELVLPKFGVSIKPLDSHVLLCRNDLVHGVAPIIKLNKASYRYSIVWYANAKMDKCGTMQEELAKARSKSAR